MSVQAYILIQTEVGKAASVAKAVSAIAGGYWSLRRNYAS